MKNKIDNENSMRIKIFKIPLIVIILLGLVFPPTFFYGSKNQALAKEVQVTDELVKEFLMEDLLSGVEEGTGTYFEVKNSEYLNISLESSEEVIEMLLGEKEKGALSLSSFRLTGARKNKIKRY